MALSKASSRIRIGATDYRWIVSSERGFMVVVIQKATGKGSRHRSVVDWKLLVTPSIVRKIILNALKGGWDPDTSDKSSKKHGVTHRIEGLEQYDSSGYRCPFCAKPEFRFVRGASFECRACRKSLDPWELHNFGGPLN
jgi:hypothetical protein